MGFFGLQPGPGTGQWTIEVVPELCSGLGTLFGGCALGAGVEALERTTGRPTVWATAQFIASARPGDTVALTVEPLVEGRSITQARAVGRRGDRDIFAVSASLGRRASEFEGTWGRPPAVAVPEECPSRPLPERLRGTIAERLEVRLARTARDEDSPGNLGDGRSGFWVRVPDLDCSAAAMALIGDHVPAGIGFALGARAGGQSLDNSIRVAELIPTTWYLVEVHIDAVRAGFAHGGARIWSEAGNLLGTADQSAIVRRRERSRR